MAAGGIEDVERAVAAARRVVRRPPLVRPSPADRKRVLLGLADDPGARRSWPCSSRSTSASRSGTRSAVDVPSAAKTIQWYAETIDKVYGEVGPTGPDALSLVTREPIGVVAAIVPWNYPLIITAWKLGAALATGNSSSSSPRRSRR